MTTSQPTASQQPTAPGQPPAESRNWEVAWFQQVFIYRAGEVEPQTLECGLTEAEATARLAYWQEQIAASVYHIGAVVIVRQTYTTHDDEREVW